MAKVVEDLEFTTDGTAFALVHVGVDEVFDAAVSPSVILKSTLRMKL